MQTISKIIANLKPENEIYAGVYENMDIEEYTPAKIPQARSAINCRKSKCKIIVVTVAVMAFAAMVSTLVVTLISKPKDDAVLSSSKSKGQVTIDTLFKLECKLVEVCSNEQCKQPTVIEKEFRMECKFVEMEGNGTQHCPEGWIHYQQSCYLFWNKTTQSFLAATSMCSRNEAHLVFVETAAENDFIKQILRTLPSNNWWMGITDEEKEGTYRYYGTNTSIVFSDWKPNEPNNHEVENCLHYYGPHDYKWNDNKCAQNYFAVCEKQNN